MTVEKQVVITICKLRSPNSQESVHNFGMGKFTAGSFVQKSCHSIQELTVVPLTL